MGGTVSAFERVPGCYGFSGSNASYGSDISGGGSFNSSSAGGDRVLTEFDVPPAPRHRRPSPEILLPSSSMLGAGGRHHCHSAHGHRHAPHHHHPQQLQQTHNSSPCTTNQAHVHHCHHTHHHHHAHHLLQPSQQQQQQAVQHSNVSRHLTSGALALTAALHNLPSRSMAKLQTLRRKVTSRLKRRGTRHQVDHCKQFREFIAGWSYRQLHALRQEYEALSVLKEIDLQALAARPSPPTIQSDLGQLLESGWLSDVQISYGAAVLDVHRAILSARSAYFRARLTSWLTKPDLTQQQPTGPLLLDSSTGNLDPGTFTALLNYLYTGSMQQSQQQDIVVSWETLALLSDKFGLGGTRLDEDLASLLDSGTDADCVLVFTHTSSGRCHSPTDHLAPPPCELVCHQAVLAARSKLLRSMLQRRAGSTGTRDSGDPMHPLPTLCPCDQHRTDSVRIVLDESIIPRRFAPLLLHCLYTDQLDLGRLWIQTPCSCRCSCVCGVPVQEGCEELAATPCRRHNLLTTSAAGESAACGSSGGHGTGRFMRSCVGCLQDVMDLYQIGRFLEFDMLCYNCEEVLVASLSLDTLLCVLRWSEEPHGSPYVHRHACHFLREEFLQVVRCPALLARLTAADLADAIGSSLLQSPESEVLAAVIRWGEHQLSRLTEEKEVNRHRSQHQQQDHQHGTSAGAPPLPLSSRGDVLPQPLESRKQRLSSSASGSSTAAAASDAELAKLVGPLISQIRLEHVLPGSTELVHSAIRRGLIRNPPPLYMVIPPHQDDRVTAWCRAARLMLPPPTTPPPAAPHLAPLIRTTTAALDLAVGQQQRRAVSSCRANGSGSFLPPRLFTPFYEELRSHLVDQYKLCKSWMDHPGPGSPGPTSPPSCLVMSNSGGGHVSPHQMLDILPSSLGTQQELHQPHSTTSPVPLLLDGRLVKAVRQRARDLEQLLLVQRALLMPCINRAGVYQQLQLRAMREVGLGDAVLPGIFVSTVPPPSTPAPPPPLPHRHVPVARREPHVDVGYLCCVKTPAPGDSGISTVQCCSTNAGVGPGPSYQPWGGAGSRQGQQLLTPGPGPVAMRMIASSMPAFWSDLAGGEPAGGGGQGNATNLPVQQTSHQQILHLQHQQQQHDAGPSAAAELASRRCRAPPDLMNAGQQSSARTGAVASHNHHNHHHHHHHHHQTSAGAGPNTRRQHHARPQSHHATDTAGLRLHQQHRPPSLQPPLGPTRSTTNPSCSTSRSSSGDGSSTPPATEEDDDRTHQYTVEETVFV